MKIKIDFAIVDLRELLIRWERCFGIELGPVDGDAIRVMKSNRYDYPPVFDPKSPGTGVGLVARERLEASRVQCLAYLVCSPRLLEVRCKTIEEMELVNALCRLVEYAEINAI